MAITILVTKTDTCLPNLIRECDALGIAYHVAYIEEHLELVSAYKIRHSSNILIDGELAFRCQPSAGQLTHYLDKH